MENTVDIEPAIMPFKVQQLVETIMQAKQLAFTDAFFYLYTTRCYRLLLQPNTKLWYVSAAGLLEMLEEEKQMGNTEHPKLLLFFAFCLESYKDHVCQTAAETLMLFVRYEVFDFLRSGFDVLHTQGKEYILSEIDEFFKHHKQ
jgi:hypothetical protein